MNKKMKFVMIICLILVVAIGFVFCKKKTAVSTLDMVEGLKDKYLMNLDSDTETISPGDEQSSDLVFVEN